MKSREDRQSRLIGPLAAVLTGVFCLLSSSTVTAQKTDSWSEVDGGGKGKPATPALPGGLPTPTSESPTPAPRPTSPPPTPLPTPDPKAFKSANEYACKAIETKADDIAASIEAKKAGNGDKKTYPGEAEYNAAFNKALKDGQGLAAAQKAGRDAVKDVLG